MQGTTIDVVVDNHMPGGVTVTSEVLCAENLPDGSMLGSFIVHIVVEPQTAEHADIPVADKVTPLDEQTTRRLSTENGPTGDGDCDCEQMLAELDDAPPQARPLEPEETTDGPELRGT